MIDGLVPLKRELGSLERKLFVPGEAVRLEGVNVFRCPVCRNEFRYDDEYEPICTGPHPSLDEHEPAVMVRVRVDAPLIQVAGFARGAADVRC